MAPISDLAYIYNVSLYKLQSFNTSRGESDGLRKLVLLNNFLYTKFIAQQPLEDVKKDEEEWLDACLDGLDEEEDDDGFVYVAMPSVDDEYINRDQIQDDVDMDFEEQYSHVIEDIIIPTDLLHSPYFDPGGTYHRMAIDEYEDEKPPIETYETHFRETRSPMDEDVSMMEGGYETLANEEFHPYWKDNSIIAPSTDPYTSIEFSNQSISIPRIFQRYRLADISSHINTSAVLRLLNQQPPLLTDSLKRSKDDLDLLYSFGPRALDKGILMDIINMLEYSFGGKKNITSNTFLSSNLDANAWFIDNVNF